MVSIKYNICTCVHNLKTISTQYRHVVRPSASLFELKIGTLVDPALKIKVKVKFRTCYRASYMRRTQDQKCFIILEVAADWHELMMPLHSMRPSIACLSEQLDPRFAAGRHYRPNQPH